jgi:Rps23 Pro-64 3,4-dihydroxylase Tpa1-like proline 4-hydroxylase
MQHLGSGIYRIENFFYRHKEFKSFILDEINKLSFDNYQNNPLKKDESNSYDFLIKPVDKSNEKLYEIVYDLNEHMLETLNKTLDAKHVSQWEDSSYCGIVTCYNPGNFFMDHNDTIYVEEDKKMTYTCVYYVNEDFDGGNLFFPSLNLTVKPIENSLVLIPSELIHRAEEIKNGKKIISTTFFRKIKNAN